jgi:hypothetical protein
LRPRSTTSVADQAPGQVDEHTQAERDREHRPTERHDRPAAEERPEQDHQQPGQDREIEDVPGHRGLDAPVEHQVGELGGGPEERRQPGPNPCHRLTGVVGESGGHSVDDAR